jgi:hypothetical protein
LATQPSSFVVTTVGNTLVAFWYGECTQPVLEKFRGELEQVALRHPGGMYVLNVISEETGMPDNAARKYLGEQFATMRGRIKAMAVVLEKRGIMGTLSRTILNTVATIARRPFEMGIVGDRSEGASWVALRASGNAGLLLQAITSLARQAPAPRVAETL